MRRPTTMVAALLAASLALALGLVVLVSPPARAAGLQQVTSFGSNPGGLSMYSYRPDGLPTGAPVVVELHGCTQDAATYFAGSGWREMADRHGFALVLAQQSSGNNANKCFNWFESGDITRGQGEAASIAAMVDHAVASYGSDPKRVYVTGLSAGGAMTAVMLAAYPDKFAGGSINAGIPYRCATSMTAAFSCMSPGADKSPAQWGDLARSGYAGYTGPRPKVAVWQGQSDTTVTPRNGEKLRDQFTNANGVSATATASGSLSSAVTWEEYAGQVRLYRIAGMGHGTAVDPGTAENQCGTAGSYFIDTVCAAYHDVVFFGLDGGKTTPTDPTSTTPTTPTTTTTSPTSSPSAQCVTASNYAHVSAGRAYHSLGYAYATGSGQNLGLYNTLYTATLRERSTGYWEKC
ncbi:extracellular catalytic domain type 1 short-chain-length polyhydroxyalkanoate depolymerase [Actinomycetota bacterium]